jgi:hypothetical protein
MYYNDLVSDYVVHGLSSCIAVQWDYVVHGLSSCIAVQCDSSVRNHNDCVNRNSAGGGEGVYGVNRDDITVLIHVALVLHVTQDFIIPTLYFNNRGNNSRRNNRKNNRRIDINHCMNRDNVPVIRHDCCILEHLCDLEFVS